MLVLAHFSPEAVCVRILLLTHSLTQGEVREFASGVVHDALKIAVTLHQGEYDPSTVQSLAICHQQQLSKLHHNLFTAYFKARCGLQHFTYNVGTI